MNSPKIGPSHKPRASAEPRRDHNSHTHALAKRTPVASSRSRKFTQPPHARLKKGTRNCTTHDFVGKRKNCIATQNYHRTGESKILHPCLVNSSTITRKLAPARLHGNYSPPRSIVLRKLDRSPERREQGHSVRMTF